jgi:hypothetical protein
LLYRSGFDSNLDAAAASSTTELSVRFPRPRAASIVIEQRRAADLYAPRWTYQIEPGFEPPARGDEPIATRVHDIVVNGSAESKANVAILCDGYRDTDYEKFTRDALRATGYLFSVEPLKKRAHDFNVRAVFASSVHSNVTDPYLGLRRNTVLGCSYLTGEAERTIVVRDNRALRDIAATVPYDFLLVLANARRYGGSGVFGGPAVVAIDSGAAAYLTIHEFAHVLGGLADEYYIPSSEVRPVGNIEPWQPNVTILQARPKWRQFITGGTRLPTPWNKSEYDAHFSRYVKRYFAARDAHLNESTIDKLMQDAAARGSAILRKNGKPSQTGLFEGANGHAQGVFRSQVDCIMFSYQTEYFCAACSSAIERMIDAHG